MTKEQAAYAATLNLLGSGVPDWFEDAGLIATLGRRRRAAAHSAGPHADCPYCYWTVPCGGPDDGEHFAALWDHLIARHEIDPQYAEFPARAAWDRAAATYEGVKAA